MEEQKELRRPELLTIVCILSFIGTGSSIFANFMLYGFHDIFVELWQEDFTKLESFEIFSEITPNYYLFNGLTSLGSLFGVIYMWNLRKIGFHVYTISQIAALSLPRIFIPQLGLTFFPIMFTAIFVILYALNLKHMK